MKKRILFFAYNLEIGGIETSLVSLLNNVDLKKYDVTLMLEKKEGVLLNLISSEIKIEEYKIFESKNIITRKVKNLVKRVSWSLKNYHQYDFSCCYATYSLSGNKICRLASKNSSLYIHSNYYELFAHNIANFKGFFDKRNLKKFRKLIFVSNESMNDLTKIYPSFKNKSIVINNLINQDRILRLAKEKCELTKPKNKKLFVFVGRLDEKSKQITKLIRVIKQVKDAELWIIGDGKDKELIENEIGSNANMKMLGQKNNPYPYMNLADYIILTSKYEGYPVVYNEAIILKKIIITTINVTDQFVSIPNNFGYIVSHHEDKMIKQIIDIINNKPLLIKNVDFNKTNEKKMTLLEKIIEEVI